MENSTTSNGQNNNFIYHTEHLWQSTEIDKFDTAMLIFHTNCPPIPLDSKAKIISKDPSKGGYEYSYSSLEATFKIIRPILAKAEIFVMQHSSDGWMTTMLRHKSGQFFAFKEKMVDWQGFGTTSVQNAGGTKSFFRRYGIFEFLGLATEDTDGRDSGQKDQRKPAPSAQPTAPKLDESVTDAWQSKVNECKEPEDFMELSAKLAVLGLEKKDPLRVFVGTAIGKRMNEVGVEYTEATGYTKKPTEKQA